MPSTEMPWQVHGGLTKSPDGHFIKYEDGSDFFWLGDTAWRLPTLRPEDIEKYFELRSRLGFNIIHFNATTWGIPNAFGEYPFEGAGPT
jgi:hypothetical protein